MKVGLYGQPFDHAGKPHSFGNLLTEAMASSQYNRLKFCVAFVTSSGTSRLYRHLRDFVDRGGQATLYAGLANGITSGQAIEQLLLAGATVFGFDTGGAALFHPKVYVLFGDGNAWVGTGSSNLTSEGLYRNFEASTIVEVPSDTGSNAFLKTVNNWFKWVHGYTVNCFEMKAEAIPKLVANGMLIDERRVPLPQRVRPSRRQRGSSSTAWIRIPAAPPPDPRLRGARTQAPAAPAPASARPPAGRSQYFAMTLSAFDCSHRTGVPGTPEVAIPEDVVSFFPTVAVRGRQYPDAYFDALLNDPSGSASVVSIRVWQRPPGSPRGHADWRLNVGHAVVDLTTQGGGDILLFERLPEGSEPAYEVWVVGTGSPEHASLVARCTRQVQASGTAGTKRWGVF